MWCYFHKSSRREHVIALRLRCDRKTASSTCSFFQIAYCSCQGLIEKRRHDFVPMLEALSHLCRGPEILSRKKSDKQSPITSTELLISYRPLQHRGCWRFKCLLEPCLDRVSLATRRDPRIEMLVISNTLREVVFPVALILMGNEHTVSRYLPLVISPTPQIAVGYEMIVPFNQVAISFSPPLRAHGLANWIGDAVELQSAKNAVRDHSLHLRSPVPAFAAMLF